MKITQEEVTHVANLSKLKFSGEETAAFATTLSKIVDMVELLGKSTQLVSHLLRPWQTARPYSALTWPKKEQTVTACLKTYLKKNNYYIKVPAILDDGGDA